MNVELGRLTPGIFGVSHGSGVGGEIIRSATQSDAGHAFLFDGTQIIQGAPPKANTVPADHYEDALWAWRMWDWLKAEKNWTNEQVTAAQKLVVGRGTEEIGCKYDWLAYLGFEALVLRVRNEQELAPIFTRDSLRVCSALVYDAEQAGKVPMAFIPSDGPGLVKNPDTKIILPPNLIAPGMLLGLAQRLEWM